MVENCGKWWRVANSDPIFDLRPWEWIELRPICSCLSRNWSVDPYCFQWHCTNPSIPSIIPLHPHYIVNCTASKGHRSEKKLDKSLDKSPLSTTFLKAQKLGNGALTSGTLGTSGRPPLSPPFPKALWSQRPSRSMYCICDTSVAPVAVA